MRKNIFEPARRQRVSAKQSSCVDFWCELGVASPAVETV